MIESVKYLVSTYFLAGPTTNALHEFYHLDTTIPPFYKRGNSG